MKKMSPWSKMKDPSDKEMEKEESHEGMPQYGKKIIKRMPDEDEKRIQNGDEIIIIRRAQRGM